MIVNSIISSGAFPELSDCHLLTPDECREAFSDDFTASEVATTGLHPSSSSSSSIPKKCVDKAQNVVQEIESIETFAEALKFEEKIRAQNRYVSVCLLP